MKTHITILLILLPLFSFSQDKEWYSFSKNDIAVMSCEVAAGYLQGFREEVLYHPHALFEKFPNLNRKFWDARWSWTNGDAYKWDANHVLKGGVTFMHVAAASVKMCDIKNYRKKDIWKKILFDMAKYYISYQVGFALSYNITHGNKFY